MRILVSCLALVLAAEPALAQCQMAFAFARPDDKGTKTLAVWEDATAGANGKALLFRDSLHVNTDGTRRSYNIDDFWGRAKAINNLCNAMVGQCAELADEPAQRARRIATQNAYRNNWPEGWEASTRLSKMVILTGADGKPCVDKDGYVLSATALHKNGTGQACDISHYVDALTTNALVLPLPSAGQRETEFDSRNAKVGDLAVAMTADGQTLVYGVVGDLGPANELGEASVAYIRALLRRNDTPATYTIVRSRAWTATNVTVLVFPGTRRPVSQEPYMEQAEIDAAAAPLFAAWGGLERLRACAGVYRPR